MPGGAAGKRACESHSEWNTRVMTTGALLTRHGREVSSVFDLLGRDENDLTAAFGFALARSPRLLRRIVQRLAPGADEEGTVLRLESRDSDGRTDLEISTADHLIVVEAKRGWLVPGETQLAKYAPRIGAHGTGVLVSLSAASPAWALQTLPETIHGVPVAHLSWEQVLLDLTDARGVTRGQERAWLAEFSDYLRKAIRMRDPADSWTYCVVVNTKGRGAAVPAPSASLSPPKAATSTLTAGARAGRGLRRTSSPSDGTAKYSESAASPVPRSSQTSSPAGPESPRPSRPSARTPCITSDHHSRGLPSPAAQPTGPHASGSSLITCSPARRSRTPASRPHR